MAENRDYIDKVLIGLIEYVLDNFDRLKENPHIGDRVSRYTMDDVNENNFGKILNIVEWESDSLGHSSTPLLDEYYNLKTELDEYVKEINETLYPNRRDLTKDLYINNKLRIEGNDIKNMILFRSLEDFLDNQIKIKHELADRFVESIKTNIEDYTLFEEIAINQYNRILDTNGVKVENFGKNIEEEIKKEVKKLKKDENGLKPINFDYRVNPKTNLVSLQLSPSQYGASIQVGKSNYLHLNINSLMNKLTPYHIEVSGELSKDIVRDIMTHSNDMMNLVAFNKSNSNEVKHVKELLHFEVNEKIEEINNLKNKGKELGLLKEELYLNKELKEELIKIRKEEGKKAKRSRDNDER